MPLRKLANTLAKDLWQAELGRGYAHDEAGHTHLGQVIVITNFRMPKGHPSAGQMFANFCWTPVQVVQVKRKHFPWNLVFSVHVSVMQDTKVPHFIYTPTGNVHIDYMKEIHDFCLSMRFNPVFVRPKIQIGDGCSYIAVDREEDALMLANYCISLGL